MTYPKLTTALVVLCLSISSLTYSQWFQQNSGINSQLLSVYFVNQNTGVASGSQGKVLRTTNGGTNWTASTVIDTIANYSSIFFPSVNTGYIAGGLFYFDSISITGIVPRIIKTTDAGLTWQQVLNDTNYTLRGIYFLNDNTGFACGGLFGSGSNEFLKTTNGGANWSVTSIGNGYLRFLTFSDANTGFANALNGTVYKTINGGVNWSQSGPLSLMYLSSFFQDNNTGFIAGGNSLGIDSVSSILRTTNGGGNWVQVFSDNKGMMNAVKFVNANTGFAVGTFDPYTDWIVPARILKTTNGGNSWYVDSVFSSMNKFCSLFFTDAFTGYVVGGDGAIFKTTNSGNPIGIQQVGSTVPKQFSLSQNYPNPFNPSTKIEFALPKTAMTRIVVYDDIGRLVTVVVDQELKAGTYKVDWDATGFPSGIYFYKLTAGDFSQTRKMVLIK